MTVDSKHRQAKYKLYVTAGNERKGLYSTKP